MTEPQNIAHEEVTSGRFRQKMILVTIAVVLLMLALPFAILGWVARDLVGSRQDQTTTIPGDTAEVAPELRANLEAVAESWSALPTLENPIPEITFIFNNQKAGDEVIPMILQQLEGHGVTLVALDPELESKTERYLALTTLRRLKTVLPEEVKYLIEPNNNIPDHTNTIIRFQVGQEPASMNGQSNGEP